MALSGLEELFDRFRREGDLDALAEVFDRTAEKLLKVARHLSQDEAQAEDVVQATFLAAIEGQESFDASRELVPWLTGILTHKAKVARALSLRAPDPERLPKHANEDPAVAAEVRDLQTTLDRALDRVPSAYRDVLRLHLRQGMDAEEIARELRRRAGTVRVQLHRGLKHLRRGLPASIALSGLAFAPGPRGIALVRTEVLGHAGTLVTTAASGGVVAGATIGGIIVGKKIAVALAIVALASSVAWLASRASPTRREEARVSAPNVAELSAPPVPEAISTPPTERSTANPTLADASSAAANLYGSLDMTWTWADGTPAAGLGVDALPFGEKHVNDSAILARTDENGHLTIEVIREGKVTVSLWRSCYGVQFETSVTAGKRTSASYVIPQGTDVHGKVVDANGVEVEGAELWITLRETDGAIAEAVSAHDGTFLLRSIGASCSFFATSDRLGSSAYVAVYELDPNHTGRADVTLKLRGESAGVHGIVRDPDGNLVAGARATLRCRKTMKKREFVKWPAIRMVTGTDGVFSTSGVHKGSAELEVFVHGLAVWTRVVELEADRTLDVDVRLEQGFTVRGVVRTTSGAPMPGASLNHGPAPGSEGYDWRPQLFAKSEDDGSYVLACIPSGDAELHAEFHDKSSTQRTATKLTGTSGQILTWDPVLEEGLKIPGRVVDERGAPLASWRVEAVPMMHGSPAPRPATTDAEGRFAITGCSRTRYSVRVLAPDEREPRCSREGVLPGAAESVLVVRPESRPSAFVTGRFLDASGTPVTGSSAIAEKLGVDASGGWTTRTDESGRFRLGPLPPGQYFFRFDRQNQTERELGPLELAADEERDLCDVQVEPKGRLELRLHRENGIPFDKGIAVWLFNERGYVSLAETDDGVLFVDPAMFPGTYRLEGCADAVAPTPILIDIRSGQTTRMETTLPSGSVREIGFRMPESELTPNKMHVVIRGKSDFVLERDCWMERAATPYLGTYGLMAAFLAGHYTYEVTGVEGFHASGAFDVAETTTPAERMEFELVRDR